MNFDQLLYFREIALTNSFTQAAENLYITQAGLTYQIKQLENELGFKLFDRDSHHVTLTEQGAILRPAVDNILSIWEESYRRATASLEKTATDLRIGVVEFMDEEALLRVNQAFRELHPTCTVVPHFLRPLVYQEYVNGLISGKSDLIFVSDDEISSMSSITFVPLGPMISGAYMRADDPLASRENLSFEDLGGRTIVFPEALLSSENKRRSEGLTQRFSQVKPDIEVLYASDQHAMDLMVADTGAVGLQYFASTKGLDPSRYAMVPLHDGEEQVRFGVAYVRSMQNPLVLDYVGLCQKEFKGND